ncbi:hypothetical protein Q5M85_17770 [Paraclostridium bifermentans]|nr:hypothetical protein [Paraclostridium bifermentans]
MKKLWVIGIKFMLWDIQQEEELAANLVFNDYFHEKYGIDKHVFKKFTSISGVLNFRLCVLENMQNQLLKIMQRGRI